MRFILLLILYITPLSAFAENWKDTFASFQWQQRQIVLFADVADNPDFIKQKEILVEGRDALSERDTVVHFAIFDDRHEVHQYHKVASKGFTLVLIGLDGEEKFRSKKPVSVEKISSVIDKMPMRLRELRIQRMQKNNKNW